MIFIAALNFFSRRLQSFELLPQQPSPDAFPFSMYYLHFVNPIIYYRLYELSVHKFFPFSSFIGRRSGHLIVFK